MKLRDSECFGGAGSGSQRTSVDIERWREMLNEQIDMRNDMDD
jgi:hypothetical protein